MVIDDLILIDRHFTVRRGRGSATRPTGFAKADRGVSRNPSLGSVSNKSVHANDSGAVGSRLQVFDLINVTRKSYLLVTENSFRQFRLIDLEHITAHEDSWDLTIFHNMITRQITANRRILRKEWYSGIQEIFLVVINILTFIILIMRMKNARELGERNKN